MTKERQKELVKYWLKTAEYNYKSTLALFKNKQYADCLFWSHLVIEKLIKGLVVKNSAKIPKPIHNLLVLMKDAKLILSEKDRDILDQINNFNIRARYPDYRLKFHKLCTKQFVERNLNKIISLYQKLCQEIK